MGQNLTLWKKFSALNQFDYFVTLKKRYAPPPPLPQHETTLIFTTGNEAPLTWGELYSNSEKAYFATPFENIVSICVFGGIYRWNLNSFASITCSIIFLFLVFKFDLQYYISINTYTIYFEHTLPEKGLVPKWRVQEFKTDQHSV